ncbi:golgi apparatus membrane protein TVP23 [Colletotrichum acutatum]
MESQQQQDAPGSLSWRLSSHPITLLTFLAFRISSVLVYFLGLWIIRSMYVVAKLLLPSRTSKRNQSYKAPRPRRAVVFIHQTCLGQDTHVPTPTALVATNTIPTIMIFIITILLLAADFYYLKNIAGRRLVGLRWWNEVDVQTGDSQWVFESSEPGTKTINPTDSRFFWLALYVQPVLWILLAVFALVRLQFLWLPLVGEFAFPRDISLPDPSSSLGMMGGKGCSSTAFVAMIPEFFPGENNVSILEQIVANSVVCPAVIALVLTIMNAMAFSRCDKFSHASNMAGSALYSGGLAGSIATGMVGRLFNRG